ncbi:RING finger protein 112-like [Lepisosteus oculatus]|uniref:RING finger protein 112-like n=1 Tax=Lepisosteus oculatus TaxID=7918 RepID=UPI0035F51AD8
MGNSQCPSEKSMSSACLMSEQQQEAVESSLFPDLEQEDIGSSLLSEPQCSICLGSFSKPVIIQCGHEFCQDCIESFWVDLVVTCPQCHKVCERASTVKREEGSGKPIQLVHVSPDGSLLLKENVLRQCFLRSDVRETPLCVVAIVGERRKGKSFLLNYLLRKRDFTQRVVGDIWMSDDEPLRGFEWQPGTETMTKGVFIWSQPLFLETQEGKRLEESGTNKQILRILREKSPCCHLMPFPGDRLLWSQQGTMQEMNEQFQHCLKEYINHIVQVLQTIQSTVTGKTLAEIFKEVAHVILTSTYRISSPAELIHALNKLTLQHVKQEFTIFLNEQRMIMHNTTQGMRRTVELKEAELKARVQGEVSQQDFQKLLEILGSERETFLKEYTLLIITREKQEFANFLNEQRRFMPDPTQGMRRTVEQKEFELLSHVQDEVSQQDFQELSEILDSQRETFLKEYTLLIIKRAMQEFTNFLHEQSNNMLKRPKKMREMLEVKKTELLDYVKDKVSQREFEELCEYTATKSEKFLQIYQIKFGLTVGCVVTIPVLTVAGGVAGGVAGAFLVGGAITVQAGIATGTIVGTTASVWVGRAASAVYERIKRNRP